MRDASSQSSFDLIARGCCKPEPRIFLSQTGTGFVRSATLSLAHALATKVKRRSVLRCPAGNSRILPMRKLPVVPICRRYFRLPRRANHHDLLAHPAPMKRDVSADRHDTWGGDAMDAEAAPDERNQGGRAKSCGPDPPT